MFQDLLRDTDIYKIIVEEDHEQGVVEGHQKGLAEGLEKGRAQGLVEGIELQKRIQQEQELQHQPEMLLHFVQARFPRLVRFAKKQIAVVTDVVVY